MHRIFSSLCKITAKGYGLPYNSDSGMSQNYVDYEAWLWNRLLYATVLRPEYNNINLVVKNEYDNRKKGKNLMVAKHKAEKERKYLLNRSLLSARITRISHQISAFIYGNANELFLGE